MSPSRQCPPLSLNRIRDLILRHERKMIVEKLLEGLRKVMLLQSLVQEVNWLGNEASKSSATYFCKDVSQIFMKTLSSALGFNMITEATVDVAAASSPAGSEITNETQATSAPVDTKIPPPLDEDVESSQWIKYASRTLTGGHHRRYYKCDNNGCLARKRVEREKDHDDPSQFKVTYLKRHTCKNNLDDGCNSHCSSSGLDQTSTKKARRISYT